MVGDDVSRPRVPDPDGAPPRLLPGLPLPPYRYLPGRGRHPLRHPEGYLYGRDQAVDPSPPETEWIRNRDHRYAIDLWNRGYLWEAHEAWEGLWKLLPRGAPEARALQGLIQAAAALIKDEMGQERAAERLFGASTARLEGALDDAGGARVVGIDIAAFLRCLARYRADPRPALYPFILLEA
jgi:predicted metal-dependent hydrolase